MCPPSISKPEAQAGDVTRRYLAEGGITPPALLRVRRNEHATDHFFWGEGAVQP